MEEIHVDVDGGVYHYAGVAVVSGFCCVERVGSDCCCRGVCVSEVENEICSVHGGSTNGASVQPRACVKG